LRLRVFVSDDGWESSISFKVVTWQGFGWFVIVRCWVIITPVPRETVLLLSTTMLVRVRDLIFTRYCDR
jgi:hypothetical protein